MKSIMSKIRKFRDSRDWMKFHDPKNLAMSIAIESAELMEHFQWRNKEEVAEYLKDKKNLSEVEEEVADIAMYLFEFTDNLGIDLLKSMERKLKINAKKYPVRKAKGVATKYDKL